MAGARSREAVFDREASCARSRAAFGRAWIALLTLLAGCSEPARARATGLQHFVFFGRERAAVAAPAFLENPNIAGAQIKYTWRELEPERSRYDLRPVLDDLAFLESHGKKLFVQLQDVSFSEDVPVPDYLREDAAFGGGAARKYECADDDESKARFDGWVARRWDPAVRARFTELLERLGGELDGRIEGLNLAETSIGFCESGALHPPGFTYAGYADGVKAIASAARRAFPRSRVILYANFMPGEWLPDADHGYLRGVYSHAESIGVGVGGPDLMPHRKGQRDHSYALIAARGSNVPAGIAVQDGNLEDRDPTTGKRATVADLVRFAQDRLRLDYVFWGTEEPYYSGEVLPYLRGLERAGAR